MIQNLLELGLHINMSEMLSLNYLVCLSVSCIQHCVWHAEQAAVIVGGILYATTWRTMWQMSHRVSVFVPFLRGNMLIPHRYLHNVKLFNTKWKYYHHLLNLMLFQMFNETQKEKFLLELQKRCIKVVIWFMLYIPSLLNHHLQWDVNNWVWIMSLCIELRLVRFMNESFRQVLWTGSMIHWHIWIKRMIHSCIRYFYLSHEHTKEK